MLATDEMVHQIEDVSMMHGWNYTIYMKMKTKGGMSQEGGSMAEHLTSLKMTMKSAYRFSGDLCLVGLGFRF